MAGGLVWAAPVVMSIKTQGAAAGSPAPSTTTTTTMVPDVCNQDTSFKSCGDVITTCGGAADCVCVQTAEGDFACVTDVYDACTSHGPPLCRSSSECPSNEPICITLDNCCGDGFGRCVQACPGAWPGTHGRRKGVGLTPLG